MTETGSMSTPTGVVLIESEWFNAHYDNGKLVRDAKPDYLDIETLAHTFPAAAIYMMGGDVYSELLDGAGYPPTLDDVPLDRLHRVR